jgi:dihydroorotate dehydrogenase (fumarate)
MNADSNAEASSFLPTPEEFVFGPDQYLEHLRRIKEAVSVPVIASINGVTAGGWTDYSKMLEQAGADALELNVYTLATDLTQSGDAVEKRTLDAVQAVKAAVDIPVAVKLSPYFSSLAHFAKQLEDLEVNGLVLFNRFYQPDIDEEALEVAPRLALSDSSELLLRLRWLAILSGRITPSLACSGGVHTHVDAVKAVMAGAHAVQVVSALLRYGPEYLRTLRERMVQWMEKNEYDSIKTMQGNMNLLHCADPGAYERANYMRVLQSWRRENA